MKTTPTIKVSDIQLIQNNKNTPIPSDMNAFLDDHYQYGIGFFETILVTHRGHFLDEHAARLNHSLSTFDIQKHIKPETIQAFIEQHQLKDCGLKLLITANQSIATIRPLTYTDDYYNIGAKVTVSPIVKGSQSLLIRHKSTNYGDNILTLRKCHKEGFNDCLFTNELGHVTESCIGNLFIIQHERLITPPLSDGLLPGIIRDYIIKTFDATEKSITLEDVKTSSGAFLTNSLVGMINITTLDHQTLPVHPAQHDMFWEYRQVLKL
jgi:4-amino-4-deoxychorismate lyase